MNAAIKGKAMETVFKEAGIGALSNIVGYGIGASSKSLAETGLKALGIKNKLITNISSNIAGTVLGTSSANIVDAKLHKKTWGESFKAGFNFKSVVLSTVLGTELGIYDTYETPPKSRTTEKKEFDSGKNSYYDDKMKMIEPYEMQEINLRTDLLPISRIQNLPQIRLNGYWKHVSFDGDRWIWVNY